MSVLSKTVELYGFIWSFFPLLSMVFSHSCPHVLQLMRKMLWTRKLYPKLFIEFVAKMCVLPFTLGHIPLVPRVHWPVSGSHTCKVVVSVVGVLLSLTCFLFSLPVVQSVSGHHVLPNYLYSSHTVCCACKGLLLQQEAPQSSVPHYTAGAWRKCSWSYFLAKADLLMISISVFHCSRRIISGHTHCLCWQITLPETRATCICIMRARLQEALSLM